MMNVAIILLATTISIWLVLVLVLRWWFQKRERIHLDFLQEMNLKCGRASMVSSPAQLHELMLSTTDLIEGAEAGELFYYGIDASNWKIISCHADEHQRDCNVIEQEYIRICQAPPILVGEELSSVTVFDYDAIITVVLPSQAILSFALKVRSPPLCDTIVLEYLHRLLTVSALSMQSNMGPKRLGLEVAIARELEEAALKPQTHGRIAWLDWAVRVREASTARWLCAMYQPTPNRTLLLLGQLAASGVAASLLHVAVNSFCETLVETIGATATPGRILEELNRFLWRPTQPIGMSCQILVFDREERRLTMASAGEYDCIQVPGETKKLRTTCQPPLGTGATAHYSSTCRDMSAGEVILLWSCGVSGDYAKDYLSKINNNMLSSYESFDSQKIAKNVQDQLLESKISRGTVLVVSTM